MRANRMVMAMVMAGFLAVGLALSAGDQAVNLGPDVNSPDNDFGPIVTADGNRLYFTSDRDGGEGGQDIWVSERKNGVWQQAVNLGPPINTQYHEGPDSITVDGKTMFFTRCDRIGKPGICDIFTAAWDEDAGKWGGIARLGPNINSDYNDSNASVSHDGQTLYFVSNRPGDAAKKKRCGPPEEGPLSKGDYDIFRSVHDGKDWGPAERLPEPVNTCGDEFHVIIHQDNQTLYFSSNGHKGLGGADIFRSKIVDGKFQDPENLGPLVNTAGDDTYFSIPASGDLAYFASDRPGTLGMLDIYSVPVPMTLEQAEGVFVLSGTVTSQGKPVAKAKVTVTKDGAEVVVRETGANGRFKTPLPAGAKYKVSASAPGFKAAEMEIDASAFQPYALVEKELALEAE